MQEQSHCLHRACYSNDTHYAVPAPWLYLSGGKRKLRIESSLETSVKSNARFFPRSVFTATASHLKFQSSVNFPQNVYIFIAIQNTLLKRNSLIFMSVADEWRAKAGVSTLKGGKSPKVITPKTSIRGSLALQTKNPHITLARANDEGSTLVTYAKIVDAVETWSRIHILVIQSFESSKVLSPETGLIRSNLGTVQFATKFVTMGSLNVPQIGH